MECLYVLRTGGGSGGDVMRVVGECYESGGGVL